MNKDKDSRPNFQQADLARDVQALTETDVSEEGLFALGRVYDKLLLHYYKHKSYLMNRYQPQAKLEAKKRYLLRLIQQAAAAGATPELFMRAQLAQLQQFADVFPAIQIVASDRAPKRYESYMKRMKKTYPSELEREQRIVEIPLPVTAKALVDVSVEALVKRMRRVIEITGALTKEQYQRELEMLARGGFLKAEFVVTLDECWLAPAFLSEMAAHARNNYNAATIVKLKDLRKQMFLSQATDERMRQYA